MRLRLLQILGTHLCAESWTTPRILRGSLSLNRLDRGSRPSATTTTTRRFAG